MLINSITLKNFRSYEDETTLNFSPLGNQNIVLIGGENGAGKSTLFEAIKLCIYGPTTYGYIGQNYNYLDKIKNNINDNAFKNKDVECFISLDLSFTEGTEVKNYTITRSWRYDNQKINETFTVISNGLNLSHEDKLYFDIYVKSIIPPSLFNLFFFDGEELSDFFTGKSANSNLKESILQLFNYDTFEILKKQLLSYQRSNSKSNETLELAQKNYDELLENSNKLKNELESLNKSLLLSEEHLDNLNVKKSKIEEDFRNSGGLLENEKSSLISKINKLENDRTNNYEYIKNFCNDTLPFLLVSDILKETKEQIYNEETLTSYEGVKNRLSSEIVEKSLLKHNLVTSNSNEIAITLLSNMFDLTHIENIESILNLSQEEKNSILALINDIEVNENTYKNKVLSNYKKTAKTNNKIKELRNKLNSTVSEDILNGYLESIHLVEGEILEAQKNITTTEVTIEQKQDELKNKEYHLTRAKNEYTTLLQSSSTLDMSNDIIKYLEELLINITEDKIRLIENEFLNIFSKIIRKENYINSIVIDNSFNTTLYINKYYNTTELLNIIKNLGFEGLDKKYGSKFSEDLYAHYKVTNNKDLEEKIRNDVFDEISISTKININDFSNGEKQIYIFSLIWAIIKSSGVEIPFIIDTPYARIDETHRNALSTTYLPNISKQVIILSTNKEIDSDLYKVIKPYLCNEYLLLYNTEHRKTEIRNGYFEV